MDDLFACGFAKLGDTDPQILIPVFRTGPGANSSYIQKISRAGLIDDFLPLVCEDAKLVKTSQNVSAKIGDNAIYAIHDEEGILYFGSEADFILKHRGILEKIAMQTSRRKRDTFSANLVIQFADAFPEKIRFFIIQQAVQSLKTESELALKVWRDAIAIPNIIRSLGVGGDEDASFFVVSTPPHCTIHSGKSFARTEMELIRRSLQPFSIDSVKWVNWHTEKLPKEDYRWLLMGQGGVARHAFGTPPFSGNSETLGKIPERFTIARMRKVPFEDSRQRSVIAVTKSDLRSVQQTRAGLLNVEAPQAESHVFNVRPIGFGSVSDRMVKPITVAKHFRDLGNVWTIGRHRLAQSNSRYQGLRASETASRVLKAASHALIEAEISELEEIKNALGILKKQSRVGIVSSTKFFEGESVEDNLARLFRSCVTTELDAESAREFVVFLPGLNDHPAKIKFTAGGFTRGAHVVPLIRRKMQSIVGFLPNVREGDERTFRRMCSLIMEDYMWVFRGEENDRLYFENQGEGMILLPVYGRENFEKAVMMHRRDGMRELIVTDFSIRESDFIYDLDPSNLLHFSEIGFWMRSEYGVEKYEDW